MAVKWTEYCNADDLKVSSGEVAVLLAKGRSHRVRIEDGERAYRISAIVIPARVVRGMESPAIETWLRNRNMRLVGLRIDKDGRMAGEAHVPKVGLTSQEFQTYVRTVARECDRIEYLILGRDME